MRCLMCESISLSHICSTCQINHLTPSIYKQKINHNIEVISFYKYQDIKKFLHTKHTHLGFYIYKILAKNSFSMFAKEFEFNSTLASIGIDDRAKSGYSHTAVLNKVLKSKSIKPLYNKLRATNTISYSGKSKQFRLLNPRNFKLQEFTSKEVILVDDIITTGSTLNQAVEIMRQKSKEVVFCLTLAC